MVRLVTWKINIYFRCVFTRHHRWVVGLDSHFFQHSDHIIRERLTVSIAGFINNWGVKGLQPPNTKRNTYIPGLTLQVLVENFGFFLNAIEPPRQLFYFLLCKLGKMVAALKQQRLPFAVFLPRAHVTCITIVLEPARGRRDVWHYLIHIRIQYFKLVRNDIFKWPLHHVFYSDFCNWRFLYFEQLIPRFQRRFVGQRIHWFLNWNLIILV